MIQFQNGRSLTLLLMCNVGKAGSDESFSVKINGSERQLYGKMKRATLSVPLQTHTEAFPQS